MKVERMRIENRFLSILAKRDPRENSLGSQRSIND